MALGIWGGVYGIFANSLGEIMKSNKNNNGMHDQESIDKVNRIRDGKLNEIKGD